MEYKQVHEVAQPCNSYKNVYALIKSYCIITLVYMHYPLAEQNNKFDMIKKYISQDNCKSVKSKSLNYNYRHTF